MCCRTLNVRLTKARRSKSSGPGTVRPTTTGTRSPRMEVIVMSNSSLVNYTKLSPNHSGKRTHAIDRITPHCVVGQCSVENAGQCLCPYVPSGILQLWHRRRRACAAVCRRGQPSWCTSSNATDQRAVTIECASDTTAPYAFKDVVYQKLITLCVDI